MPGMLTVVKLCKCKSMSTSLSKYWCQYIGKNIDIENAFSMSLCLDLTQILHIYVEESLESSWFQCQYQGICLQQ